MTDQKCSMFACGKVASATVETTYGDGSTATLRLCATCLKRWRQTHPRVAVIDPDDCFDSTVTFPVRPRGARCAAAVPVIALEAPTMPQTITCIGWTVYGDIRGQLAALLKSAGAAYHVLRRDQNGCHAQGGYSDASVCAVGSDGYLYSDATCRYPVWPSHGRSCGAVRFSGALPAVEPRP